MIKNDNMHTCHGSLIVQSVLYAAQRPSKGLPVLCRHDVVQNGINGGREVVADS